jgi:hypothetical protein
MQCKQSLLLRLLLSVMLQLRKLERLLKQRQVNAVSSCSCIAFPVHVSRDREVESVTAGVRVKQAQLARISIFSRSPNYIHVMIFEISVPKYR